MRILFALLGVLILAFGAAGQLQINPNTIGSLEADVTIQVTGSFSGELTSQDEMEIKVLTFQSSVDQTIENVNEKLVIANQTILPTYETQGDNKFAVFKLTNLLQYADNPNFEIYTNAHIKRVSLFGLTKDYSLANPIKEQTEYLAPSHYIESDNADLIAKASIEFSSYSELETIRQITQWVHQNISYDRDNYYKGDASHPNGIWSATETYQNRAGVCDEFANLTAAFLRIKGIPTRYVSGISFDGTNFGNHGWLEAYLPGTGWIGVDSTYGEAGYLDAMHIRLGKTLDANQIKNVSILTKSVHSLQLNAEVHEPFVNLTTLQTKEIENLVRATLSQIPKLKLQQPFEAELKLQNTTSSGLIVPAELHLHSDFSLEQPDQLVLLSANETKTITWTAVSPQTGKPGFLSSYGMRIELPDQTIENDIDVEPALFEQPKFELEIGEITPKIENQSLSVQIQFNNKTDQDKTITAKLTQNQNRNQQQQTLPATSQATVTVTLMGIKPGLVQLDITGDAEKTVLLKIPEKPSEPVIVNPTPDDQNTNPQPPNSDSNQATQNPPQDFLSKLIQAILEFFQKLFAGA